MRKSWSSLRVLSERSLEIGARGPERGERLLKLIVGVGQRRFRLQDVGEQRGFQVVLRQPQPDVLARGLLTHPRRTQLRAHLVKLPEAGVHFENRPLFGLTHAVLRLADFEILRRDRTRLATPVPWLPRRLDRRGRDL